LQRLSKARGAEKAAAGFLRSIIPFTRQGLSMSKMSTSDLKAAATAKYRDERPTSLGRTAKARIRSSATIKAKID
jgi:hypothetical protein